MARVVSKASAEGAPQTKLAKLEKREGSFSAKEHRECRKLRARSLKNAIFPG